MYETPLLKVQYVILKQVHDTYKAKSMLSSKRLISRCFTVYTIHITRYLIRWILQTYLYHYQALSICLKNGSYRVLSWSIVQVEFKSTTKYVFLYIFCYNLASKSVKFVTVDRNVILFYFLTASDKSEINIDRGSNFKTGL